MLFSERVFLFIPEVPLNATQNSNRFVGAFQYLEAKKHVSQKKGVKQEQFSLPPNSCCCSKNLLQEKLYEMVCKTLTCVSFYQYTHTNIYIYIHIYVLCIYLHTSPCRYGFQKTLPWSAPNLGLWKIQGWTRPG